MGGFRPRHLRRAYHLYHRYLSRTKKFPIWLSKFLGLSHDCSRSISVSLLLFNKNSMFTYHRNLWQSPQRNLFKKEDNALVQWKVHRVVQMVISVRETNVIVRVNVHASAWNFVVHHRATGNLSVYNLLCIVILIFSLIINKKIFYNISNSFKRIFFNHYFYSLVSA